MAQNSPSGREWRKSLINHQLRNRLLKTRSLVPQSVLSGNPRGKRNIGARASKTESFRARYRLQISETHWSAGNHILTLDEAAGKLPCPDVRKDDIARYSAKERSPGTNEHRNASYDEALNEAGMKKPLNGEAAIHI